MSHIPKTYILAFIIYLYSASVYAGIYGDYKITRLSLTEGLSQSSVTRIAQDHQGFMWFATEDGLNKYDGYKFMVYKNDAFNTNSISENNIYSLCEGKNGEIWIGTASNGLNRFDLKRRIFTRYTHNPGDSLSISNNVVYDVLFDKRGRLWAATANGLNMLDTSSGKFTRFFSNAADSNSLPDNFIYRLHEDKKGNIWISGLDFGLCMFNSEKGIFRNFKHNPEDSLSLPDNNVRSLASDNTDSDFIWVGTSFGRLVRININTGKIYSSRTSNNSQNLPQDGINAIVSDSLGNIWVATSSSGLYKLDINGNILNNFSRDSGSLPRNDIYSLYISRSGIVWAGLNGAGLCILDRIEKKFRIYRYEDQESILPGSMVTALYEDQKKNLWIGSYNNGITIYNPAVNKTKILKKSKNGLNTNLVFSIFGSRAGKIFITSEDGGVNIYNPISNSFSYLLHDSENSNSISNNTVLSGYEDSNGIIWFGMYDNGLDRWDPETNSFKNYKHNLSDPKSLAGDKIYAIYEDRYNNLWFATERNGISRYNSAEDNFTNYSNNVNDKNSISNNDVISFYQDKSGAFWIGTYGGGLNRFDYENNTFNSYKEKDGLSNNVVYGILEDEEGHLWISTNKGISRFNPQTEKFKTYDVFDGLQSNEFNSAYCKISSGEMYFGGVNGLNSFFPAEIKDNRYIPPVYITGMQVLNKEVNVLEALDGNIILSKDITYTQNVSIKYEYNVISFEFAALNYINSHKNSYSYMLEGFDKSWNNSDNRRFATYSNLPPGKYLFRVKGSNNDHVWNEKGAALAVEIIPAYWQTWWFMALIGIFIISVITGAHFYRIIVIRTKNKELRELNNKLYKEVEQRKQIEADLVVSKTRFSQLAQATFEAIFILDKRKIIEVNESAIEMFGFTRIEIIGKELSELIIPDDEEIKNKIQVDNYSGYYSAKGLKNFGKVFYAEVNSKEINYNNYLLHVAAVTDISDRVKADREKELLENQLRQVQKMDAIGSLAGGVAHDFNNLLTIISGFAEMASIKLNKKNPAYKDVSQVLSTAQKASQLTRQLLTFSRKETFKPIVLDVNILIANLEIMIKRLLPVDIRLEKKLDENLPMVFADPGQLEQILMNLIVNARDAIIEKVGSQQLRKIFISTEKVMFDDEYVSRNIGSRYGEHICIKIRDTGTGIPRYLIDKIYEPFFTTKPEGKGTGLGLSTVYGIVKQNDATIQVDTKLNAGTTFSIYWPSTEQQYEENGLETFHEIHKSDNEKILFVDDEEGVRDFAATTLKRSGYNVVLASNAHEALELIGKEKTRFELLISDLNMPDMNGHELTKKILKLVPDLKVLIISGYNDEFFSQGNLEKADFNFLQKPFSMKTLLSKVREVLNKN
jgi:PAS domain S-box-containing protein